MFVILYVKPIRRKGEERKEISVCFIHFKLIASQSKFFKFLNTTNKTLSKSKQLHKKRHKEEKIMFSCKIFTWHLQLNQL